VLKRDYLKLDNSLQDLPDGCIHWNLPALSALCFIKKNETMLQGDTIPGQPQNMPPAKVRQQRHLIFWNLLTTTAEAETARDFG
jgi:hypothetical protein